MSYSDFDFYDWVPGLKSCNLSEKYAEELIKVNGQIIEYTMENSNGDFDEFTNKSIKNSSILMNLAAKLDKLDFIKNGVFVKMHRSPKDADYDETNDPNFFKASDGYRIVFLLVRSLRISEDLEEYLDAKLPLKLFISPFIESNINNEFRIFVKENQMIGYSPIPECTSSFEKDHIEKFCQKAFEEYGNKAPRPTFCMDIEILESSYRLFEFNPLDSSTDLYNLDESLLNPK